MGGFTGEGEGLPDLVPGNQLLAAAPQTANAAVKAVDRCLMMIAERSDYVLQSEMLEELG